MKPVKVGIVGGGASGLVAGIAAAREGAEVFICERGNRVGKKILATGNGRCNLTNQNADCSHYYGENTKFMLGVINRFWVEETLQFFSELGIVPKTEQQGKVYPYSDQASAVLDVLRLELERLGVQINTGFDVQKLQRQKEFELIPYQGKKLACDKVVLAAGGKAAPDLGSNGSGYGLVHPFGHSCTKLTPSLVQLRTETEVVKKLKGIKFVGSITADGVTEEGEILFTDYGLSGPPVFSLSAKVKNPSKITLNLLPAYPEEQLLALLKQRRQQLASRHLEDFLVGLFHRRVGQVLLKDCGIAPLSRTVQSLTNDEIGRLTAAVKAWEFKVEGRMSWNNAQVTAGGIRVKEIRPDTMESKLVPGLYFAGEVLDIDGDCGGYNLQWAWASGYLAGKSAALNSYINERMNNK